MAKKCEQSACAFCPDFKTCTKRLPRPCYCGNNVVAVLFQSMPRKVLRKKSIGVYVVCPKCDERTRTYAYEYQAVKAWNEMMRRAKK